MQARQCWIVFSIITVELKLFLYKTERIQTEITMTFLKLFIL